MSMREMLKRTTAVAAIVVLPVAAVAAGNSAQNNMPQDMTATIQNQLQSPVDATGPDQNGQSAQTEAGQQLENTVERQVKIPVPDTGQTGRDQQGSRLDTVQGPESVPLENPHIKVYKSHKPEAPAHSTVVKKNGEYLSKSAGWHTGGNSANAADTAGQSAQNENAGKTNEVGNQTAGSTDSSGQAAQGAQNAPASDQATPSENGTAAASEGNPGTASNQENGSVAAGQTNQQSKAGENAGQQETVATVNGKAINRADVIAMIGAMPPQVRQGPPEMVVPLAVDQLVLRQLILQQAQKENLQDDEQVLAMANNRPQQDKESAMVQVWLDRQLTSAVTDQKVQDAYDTVEQRLGDQTPPLDQIRPQIEDQLRQQAFQDIASNLQKNADVVFYGSNGEPLPSTE